MTIKVSGYHLGRIRLCDLQPGLAQAEPHLPKQPLILPYPQGHTVLRVQMLGQQLAIPQTGRKAESGGQWQ